MLCRRPITVPLFENMLTEVFKFGKLNQAIITLILKKEMDPTDCKS